jgi:hypothetical protein
MVNQQCLAQQLPEPLVLSLSLSLRQQSLDLPAQHSILGVTLHFIDSSLVSLHS